jgi:hypothetical protein
VAVPHGEGLRDEVGLEGRGAAAGLGGRRADPGDEDGVLGNAVHQVVDDARHRRRRLDADVGSQRVAGGEEEPGVVHEGGGLGGEGARETAGPDSQNFSRRRTSTSSMYTMPA